MPSLKFITDGHSVSNYQTYAETFGYINKSLPTEVDTDGCYVYNDKGSMTDEQELFTVQRVHKVKEYHTEWDYARDDFIELSNGSKYPKLVIVMTSCWYEPDGSFEETYYYDAIIKPFIIAPGTTVYLPTSLRRFFYDYPQFTSGYEADSWHTVYFIPLTIPTSYVQGNILGNCFTGAGSDYYYNGYTSGKMSVFTASIVSLENKYDMLLRWVNGLIYARDNLSSIISDKADGLSHNYSEYRMYSSCAIDNEFYAPRLPNPRIDYDRFVNSQSALPFMMVNKTDGQFHYYQLGSSNPVIDSNFASKNWGRKWILMQVDTSNGTSEIGKQTKTNLQYNTDGTLSSYETSYKQSLTPLFVPVVSLPNSKLPRIGTALLCTEIQYN